MASTDLLVALIERGAIGAQTEIEAKIPVRGFGPTAVSVKRTFSLEGVSLSVDRTVAFDAVCTIDGARRMIPGDAVTAIDGMAPERFAQMVGAIDLRDPNAPPRRPGRPARRLA